MGAARARQLGSAARVGCSRGTRPFKHRQPGMEVAGKGQQMRLHPRNREWTRVRTRRGRSSGFSRQNPGLARPSKERGASPGDPAYPVSITEGISHGAKGPFLFCGFYRGARGWLPLCMLKPAPGGGICLLHLQYQVQGLDTLYFSKGLFYSMA